jgi:hypothetical protein
MPRRNTAEAINDIAEDRTVHRNDVKCCIAKMGLLNGCKTKKKVFDDPGFGQPAPGNL